MVAHSRPIRVIQLTVTLAIFVFVGFGVFGMAITPAYPRYEYAKPDFPRDAYGWSQAQRLELALVAVDYLRRPEPAEDVIYLLEEQRKPGTDEPLYNEREIGHMIDVKRVSDGLIRRGRNVAGIIAAIGLLYLLWNPATRLLGYRAIMRGGAILTLFLIGLGAFILLGWNAFFTLFHELLFPPDTWMFPYDDTLIRLFPNKFWFDIGVLATGSVLVAGLIVWAAGYLLVRRSRQEAV